MKKKMISLVLLVTLAVNLAACRHAPESPATPMQSEASPLVLAEPQASGETAPGYISTEIETPDWVFHFGQTETAGDAFYAVAYPREGGLAAARYDTVSGDWKRYTFALDGLSDPSVALFSATEGSLWLILHGKSGDGNGSASKARGIDGYTLLHVDTNTGAQTSSPIAFWQEGSPYLMSLIALDPTRALVGDGETAFLINTRAEITGAQTVPVMGDGLHAWVDGVLYLQTKNGLAALDPETLQFGSPIEEIYDQSVYSSSLGHFLTTKNHILYRVDPDSGSETALFAWADVALSYSRLYGWVGLENRNGDIFHMTDRITKISRGEVPVKKVLTLACLGDASGEGYDYAMLSYTCTDALMDAVLRFNNSDPEYKIEIRPYIYHDEAERSRVLIEIATGHGVDLLDTSLLPQGALDKALLVDMLPYLDADGHIRREDFIPALFNGMIRGGGLYEFSDKYTLLTMITHPDFSAGGDWSVAKIRELIARHPTMRLPAEREKLISVFSLAATAAFIDWEEMRCHFDSPDFIAWLTLLQALPATPEGAPTDPMLFQFVYDAAREAGFAFRNALKNEYDPVGFPTGSGTGSYFVKEGLPDTFGANGTIPNTGGLYTLGCSTSLGILAASENRDGAWRFVRTFMLGEEEPNLRSGIPALAAGFERAVEVLLRREDPPAEGMEMEIFNETDAQLLRELVYQSTQLACTDAAVMDTLRAAINAYLGGKGSAEETARQIQSRVSLYLAEQG